MAPTDRNELRPANLIPNLPILLAIPKKRLFTPAPKLDNLLLVFLICRCICCVASTGFFNGAVNLSTNDSSTLIFLLAIYALPHF